jgi:hypothetical protein
VSLPPSLRVAVSLFLCLGTVPIVSAQNIDAVRMPLTFERNQGQLDKQVHYLVRSGNGTIFLTDHEMVMSSRGAKGIHVVRMVMRGAASIAPKGEMPTGGFANYYLTREATEWKTRIPLVSQVRYTGIYPGIDAVFHGNGDELEYDFEIAPGGSPKEILLQFEGAEIVRAQDGGLNVIAGSKLWHLLPPTAFQAIGGTRTLVAAKYHVGGTGRITFEVGDYDHASKLIIDPVVEYADILSANNGTDVSAIRTDAAGNLIIAGQTFATDYPVRSGSPPSPSGTQQVYVTKINPSGSTIIYSTYMPASAFNGARALAVDGSGNAYVAGIAGAVDFPVTSSNLGSCSQFCNAGFVAKFGGDGSLVYSTLLASGQVLPQAITVDGNGSAYVAGIATDGTLQTVNAFQPNYAGMLCTTCQNAFFAKLNAAGTNYVFASYFAGPAGGQLAKGIALDSTGNLLIAGLTSTDPPLAKPWQSGTGALFLTKFAADGKTLLFSTRLGTSGFGQPAFETLAGMAVGPDDTVYLAGSIGAQDYPYTLNAMGHPSVPNGQNSFGMYVTAINPSLSKLTYSTYLGDGFITAVAVDPANHLHVVGTQSQNLTPLKNAFLSDVNAAGTGFTAELDATGAPVTVSMMGGRFAPEIPTGVAVDSFKNVYIAGNLSPQNSVPPFPADPLMVGPGVEVNQNPTSYATFFAKIAPAGGAQISVNTAPPVMSIRNAGSADLHISNIGLSGALTKKWGNCGSTIAAGASCILTTSDDNGLTASGAVVITSDATPSTQTFPMTVLHPGAGIGDILYFQETQFLFPAQLAGTKTETLPLHVWNVGTANAAIQGVTTTGYALQTNNCATTLAPGEGCTIQVSATPTSGGINQGSLRIAYDTFGMQEYDNIYMQTITSQQVLLSANAIDFGIQQVGGVAIPRTVALTNTGDTTIAAPSTAIAGDPEFALLGNTCTAALGPHQSCVVAVQFTPAIDGGRSATLNVSGQGGSGQVTLNAQGQIGSVVQVSPLELDFPPIAVGSSFPSPLTLTNTSTSSVTMAGTSFSSADYTETDACNGQIAAGGTCTINVAFAPSQLGPRNAHMSITFAGGVIAQVLTLTGSGVTPLVIAPMSLDFGSSTVVGAHSDVQFVELQNGGPFTIPYSLAVTGDFAITNTCATPMPKFFGCPVNVIFQPKSVGGLTGTLEVIYPNISVRSVVKLSGTAIPQFTMQAAAGGSVSTSVKSGGTATYQLSLAGASGFSAMVQLSCSGAPQFATCAVQPTSVTLPATTTVTVTVTTTSSAAAQAMKFEQPAFWAIICVPILLGLRRRARIVTLILAAAIAVCGLGCGGGSSAGSTPIVPPPVTPSANTTPAGTYTLQVTASGGTTSQSVPLTLVVQ